MATLDKYKQDPMGRLHGISNVNNGRKIKAIFHVGQAVNMAVEKFMTIAENIAEDNPEIKSDMHEACKDARDAGKSIERICEIESTNAIEYPHQVETFCDYSAILIASKSLLASVTRVLLLVDIVIVKQLLTAKKKVNESLDKLQSVMNFTEFVRAFSIFGIEIVELAHLTGRQRNFFREERRQAQMNSARQILERSIPMLLTSSKTSLVHCDCSLIKENRDTVFCQIRRAIDLIHFVVKDSILTSSASNEQTKCARNGEKRTIYSILKQINYLMECIRPKSKILERKLYLNQGNRSSLLLDDNNWYDYNTSKYDKTYLHPDYDDYHQKSFSSISATSSASSSPITSNNKRGTWRNLQEPLPLFYAEVREQLIHAFEFLFETTHDFTDSAYTNHENRETILLLCQRCKIDLNNYLGNMFSYDDCLTSSVSRRADIDALLNSVKNLCDHLVISVGDQMQDLYYSLKMSVDLVLSFQNSALNNDIERLQEQAVRFQDFCDHIIDVCKLLQHIAFTETIQVQAHCLAINLRIYGPQVLTAAKILWKYAASNAANDNFEAFAEMWKWLIAEITSIVKKILMSTKELKDGRTTEYVPNETKTAMTVAPATSTTLTTTNTAATGKPIPLKKAETEDLSEFSDNNASTEENPYHMKWPDTADNDILKRARNMSAMAFLMYQFTKGSGTLKTTQDLFTQAEYFAEEANRLYKVLRQFSYQVPASDNKKDLLGILDRVPTFVQTLQFTVKDHTVGKAATFVKVDHVIRETKNLMGVINSVVTKCFECANKYKLDFSSLNGGRTPGSPRGDDNSAGGIGDSKGTTNSSEGSM